MTSLSIDARGANRAELPMPAPTKFDLVIHFGDGEALGIEVPMLLARADEVIE